MIPTPNDPVATLGFFLIVFVVIGAFFLFIHLVAGSFVRPNRPDAEKLTIYECGEPTVGSAWVQFDLRYYVVALLFVIFDVEVAFFFPWATVFGKANQLANLPAAISKDKWDELTDAQKEAQDAAQKPIEDERKKLSEQLLPSGMSEKTKIDLGLMKREKGARKEDGTFVLGRAIVTPIPPEVAKGWAIVAFGDIFLFFGILMVGFAYVWRRGDINWVRTYAHHEEPPIEPERTLEQPAPAPAPAAPVASHH
jgi:NADH-quinone oxidoreductase subunit A